MEAFTLKNDVQANGITYPAGTRVREQRLPTPAPAPEGHMHVTTHVGDPTYITVPISDLVPFTYKD